MASNMTPMAYLDTVNRSRHMKTIKSISIVAIAPIDSIMWMTEWSLIWVWLVYKWAFACQCWFSLRFASEVAKKSHLLLLSSDVLLSLLHTLFSRRMSRCCNTVINIVCFLCFFYDLKDWTWNVSIFCYILFLYLIYIVICYLWCYRLHQYFHLDLFPLMLILVVFTNYFV